MEIKGFIQNSLLEWDGRISCVIFLPLCNFRCKYCHAGHLLEQNLLESIEEKQILAYMEKQKNWLDGAVITGGEPTLHGYELLDFILRIKAIGLDVMLETNGTNPKWVKKLLNNNRINAISMDIKAPLDAASYRKVTGVDFEIEFIRESVKLILQSAAEHEFRITLVPGLVGKKEVMKIVKELKGAQTIALQNFQPDHCLDKTLQQVSPFTPEQLEEMAGIARPFAKNVVLRGENRAVLAASRT